MTFLTSLVERFQKNLERRAAIGQLSSMTDRELSDIGINRADIYDIVRQDMTKKSRK